MKVLWLIPILFLAITINIHNYWLPELNKFDGNINYYRSPDNQPYLHGNDVWYYYRLMRDAEDGHIGDEYGSDIYRINTNINSFIFMPSIAAMLNNVLHLPSMTFAYFFPTMIMVLIIFSFFFLAKKIFDIDVALISTFLLSIHPRFYSATKAGFFDTTGISILFTIVVIYCFIKIQDHVFWTLPMLSMLYLFSIHWIGAIYLLPIIVLSMIPIVLLNPLIGKKYLPFFLTIGVFSIIKYKLLIGSIKHILSYINQSNIFITVAELQPLPLKDLTQLMQPHFLIAAIIGLYFIYRFRNIKNVILFPWFILLFFVSFNNARTLQFLVLPLCMLAGYAIYLSVKHFSQYEEFIYILVPLIVIVFILFTLFTFVRVNDNSVCDTCPLMSDALWSSAEFIHTLPGEKLVITWWDYGYVYQAISEVKTLSDGGSYDIRKDSRVAKALLSESEDEFISYLFPLANFSHRVFFIITEDMLNKVQSIQSIADEGVVSPRTYNPIILKSTNNSGRIAYVPPELKDTMFIRLSRGNETFFNITKVFDTKFDYPLYVGRVIVYEIVI